MVKQNKLQQAALEYASKGIGVFPLVPGDKKPLGSLAPHGCKDATTDEETIATWWETEPTANIGLSTDGLLVVDIDGHNNEWLTNSEKLSGLHEGAISETPSGGRHYVFLGNDELRNTTGTLAPHVDTRANGGYIVAAPSVVNGKPYKWFDGCELDSRDNLAPVPDWIVDSLNTTNEGPVKLEGNTISKGVQHKTLFRLACKMRRSGHSFDEINASLQIVNLKRCEDPGTEKAIEDIARSASRYDPDQITVAFIEDHYSQMQQAEQEDKFTWMTAAELNASDYKIDYFIDHIFAKFQPMVIAGGQKTCKTNIGSDLAISLATEKPFLGKYHVNGTYNVAFISCESGAATLQDNNRRVSISKGVLPSTVENLFYCFDIPSLDSEIDLLQLQAFIEENEIDVMIIDPFYLTANLGNDAGNLFIVGEKLKPLTLLMQETDCTIVLIHHTRKNTGQKEFAEPRMEDIAYSGLPQWMRQWILLGRREAYDGDTPGSHKFWFNAGGSAGHSAFFGLDIEEGSQNDPEGRRWDVEVKPAQESRANSRSAQEQQADQKREAKLQGDVESITNFLRLAPSTKTKIYEGTGIPHGRIGQALFVLLSDKAIEKCEVLASNNQGYAGYKLSSSSVNSLVETADTANTITHTLNPPKGGSVDVCVSDQECEALNDIFPTDSNGDQF